MYKTQIELHRTNRVGWLRAAVLGANDGLLSTSSLVMGVAAAHGTHGSILIAGTAGLVAGSMAMAAGEYVSVHSQADTEQADLRREGAELARDAVAEHEELASIYIGRGLDQSLADEVAMQLMAHNALEAHARDELGISEVLSARPIQAAVVSAASFAIGAVIPLTVASLTPMSSILWLIAITSLLCLGLLGAAAAKIGGASLIRGALRVIFWGVLAMGITTAVGIVFGTRV